MACIYVSRPEPHVAMVAIDNPPANRLGHEIRETLLESLQVMNADESVRVIILTGKGDVFCAGDNLREAVERGEGAVDSLKQFVALLEEIEGGRVPVIAAMNGPAVGGGMELALACDIRVGDPRAEFIAAGVNVGLMASVYRLPRLIGIGPAKDILLTGLPVKAKRALHLNLITELFSEGELIEASLGIARRIASRAPLSVEASKRQAIRAFDLSQEEGVRAQIDEARVLCKSQDHFTAVDAFVRRVEPVFERK